jgi:hypothetical protein
VQAGHVLVVDDLAERGEDPEVRAEAHEADPVVALRVGEERLDVALDRDVAALDPPHAPRLDREPDRAPLEQADAGAERAAHRGVSDVGAGHRGRGGDQRPERDIDELPGAHDLPVREPAQVRGHLQLDLGPGVAPHQEPRRRPHGRAERVEQVEDAAGARHRAGEERAAPDADHVDVPGPRRRRRGHQREARVVLALLPRDREHRGGRAPDGREELVTAAGDRPLERRAPRDPLDLGAPLLRRVLERRRDLGVRLVMDDDDVLVGLDAEQLLDDPRGRRHQPEVDAVRSRQRSRRRERDGGVLGRVARARYVRARGRARREGARRRDRVRLAVQDQAVPRGGRGLRRAERRRRPRRARKLPRSLARRRHRLRPYSKL